MEELKPCPFCGAQKAELVKYDHHYPLDSYHYGVRCMNCGANGPDSNSEQQTVICDWNTRAEPPTDNKGE